MSITLKNDRGAIVLEHAIMIPIIIALTAAVFDFGLMLHRYTVLSNLATKHSRAFIAAVSSDRQQISSCKDVSDKVMASIANDPLYQEMGGASNVAVKSKIINQLTPDFPGGPIPPPELELNASMDLGCFFCGIPGVKNFKLSAVISSGIHNSKYSGISCSA